MPNSLRKTPAKGTKRNDAQAAVIDPDSILIKKYPNRRLYNTSSSAYIVLDDIVDLIKSNAAFIIIDQKTGEDITRSILNQIIFEREVKPRDYHLTLEVQKQLISMYGDTYAAMVPDYLTESMKLFFSEKNRMSEAMGSVVNRNAQAMMDFSQSIARQNMELFKKSWQMIGAMNDSNRPVNMNEPKSEQDNNLSEDNSRQDELERMQAEIDQLQKRLKSLK